MELSFICFSVDVQRLPPPVWTQDFFLSLFWGNNFISFNVCVPLILNFFSTEDVSSCLTNVTLPGYRFLWSCFLSILGLYTIGWKQYVTVLCINGMQQKELFIPSLPVVLTVLLWYHKGTSYPFLMAVVAITLLLAQSSPSSYLCRNLAEARNCFNQFLILPCYKERCPCLVYLGGCCPWWKH